MTSPDCPWGLALGGDPWSAVAIARTDADAAYFAVLGCDFSDALDLARLAGDGARARAVTLLVEAMLGTEVTDVALDQVAGAVRADGNGWYFLAEAAMAAGQLKTACRVTAEALAGVADPVERALLLQARARALAFTGEVDRAWEVVEQELLPATDGTGSLRRVAVGVTAYVAALRGDRAAARGAAELTRTETPPRTYLDVGAQVLAAFAWRTLGCPDRMAAQLLEAAGGELLPRLQHVDRAYAYEILASAALERADPHDAARWDALGTRLGARLGSEGMAAAAVARTNGLVAHASGDHDRAAERAEHARRTAGSRGGRIDAGRGQVLRARALAGSGARSVALAELESVIRDASAMGAGALRADAVRHLRELGRRFRADTGPDALTPREAQIARMVAEGSSNREIASALVLSERTVEAHVASVLRVLGVPTRTGVPAVLERVSPPVDLPALTSRQRQVVALVATGQGNRDIAATLEISEKAVEKHLADVFARWGVRSRTAVASRWRGLPEVS